MGWKGMLIGSYLGGVIGHLPGSIIGAFVGHKLEERFFGHKTAARRPTMRPGERSMVFCTSAAAMMAKMAKADGVVTRDEIDGVERAFLRLGFSPAARRYAVDAFRKAKDDRYSIYDYAREFAAAVHSVEVRELFYEILWDIACADGKVSQTELQILQRIPAALASRLEWFGFFASERLRGRSGAAPQRNALADAYAVIGAKASDSVDVLKRKYRELAKKNHPDALRAQGLPEDMVGKATERMSRINSAWATIRAARGI